MASTTGWTTRSIACPARSAGPRGAARRRPCRLWPLVAVPGPLEVLGRSNSGTAVTPSVTANSDTRPVQELLDHHRPAGPRVRPGGLEIPGDQHALARGQRVVLDHVGRPNAASAWSASSADVNGSRVGIPASAMTCLANDFEPSILAAAASGPSRDAASRRASAARHQRRLRADHDQVGAELRASATICSGTAAVSGWVSARPRSPVPRRRVQAAALRAQRADDGVLPAARPDDENAHATSLPAFRSAQQIPELESTRSSAGRRRPRKSGRRSSARRPRRWPGRSAAAWSGG